MATTIVAPIMMVVVVGSVWMPTRADNTRRLDGHITTTTTPQHGGGSCTGVLDCQLNGKCVSGSCVCSPQWTGANCSLLNLRPATRGQGLGAPNSTWSYWGNSAHFDPVSSAWFMAADEMSNQCGLQTWGTNSRCVMVRSDVGPSGPYEVVSVVIDPWCHGSALARDPVSGRWIYGHMGHGQSGTDPKCSVCTSGVTPKDAPTAPCPRESNVTVSVVGALVADSPLGPWMPAQNIINGANCVSFFTRNGTLFQACPWEGKVDDPTCNNQNAGLTLSRAESLEDALAGRYTYRDLPPTTLLGGTNTSHPCANWEGNNIWVDENGWFHSLAHAFRGQPTTYPVPGCVERRGVTQQCTASAGHSYSMDGKTWYISPVAPFTPILNFADGTNMSLRARERNHVVFDPESGVPIYLGNGCGNPGAGENVGLPGADHTWVQLQPISGTNR